MNKELYKYNLSSSHDSSEKYGKCEICGKHATEVFIQSEQRHYVIKKDGMLIHEGWTANKCNNYFGHEECLKSKQR